MQTYKNVTVMSAGQKLAMDKLWQKVCRLAHFLVRQHEQIFSRIDREFISCEGMKLSTKVIVRTGTCITKKHHREAECSIALAFCSR